MDDQSRKDIYSCIGQGDTGKVVPAAEYAGNRSPWYRTGSGTMIYRTDSGRVDTIVGIVTGTAEPTGEHAGERNPPPGIQRAGSS